MISTKFTKASVKDYIEARGSEQQRADSRQLIALLKQLTNKKPKMWGPSIVGFGTYHYKYASGREGDWMITGFSPRKKDLTLYIMMGFEKHPELMKQLGKYSTGKSCLYIKRLSDINIPTLKKLIKSSVKDLRDYTASRILNADKRG